MTIYECAHCHARIPAPRSRWLGALALGLAYVVTFALVASMAWTGPPGFVLLAVLLPGGMGAIGWAHAYASDERPCPACGKLAGRVASRSRRRAIGRRTRGAGPSLASSRP